MSDDQPNPVVTNPVVLNLEIDRENVMLDDYLMMVDLTSEEKLDPNDPDFKEKVKERGKKEKEIFAMLDRLVVGGIRGRGIKYSQLGEIMKAVFSAIGNAQDLKN